MHDRIMPRERTRRSVSAQRVFMITGVEPDKRITLGKNIQKLGAVYAKSDHFQSNATHIVCGELTRSEKFLGALALGRWVVRPQYVVASLKAGRWLDEVDFEWSSLSSPTAHGTSSQSQELAAAAKRNRWRMSTSSERIFTDWQVAVVMADSRRQAVYKRLLALGGAKVMDVKLPVKDPDKYGSFLTYLFADTSTLPLTQSLQAHGVLCLNCNFISDYLVLHPLPDPLDYLLKPLTEDDHKPSADHRPSADHSMLSGLGQSSNTCVTCPATRPAPSSSTPATVHSRDHDDDDDNDMLILTQCLPSRRLVSLSKNVVVPSSSCKNRNNGDVFAGKTTIGDDEHKKSRKEKHCWSLKTDGHHLKSRTGRHNEKTNLKNYFSKSKTTGGLGRSSNTTVGRRRELLSTSGQVVCIDSASSDSDDKCIVAVRKKKYVRVICTTSSESEDGVSNSRTDQKRPVMGDWRNIIDEDSDVYIMTEDTDSEQSSTTGVSDNSRRSYACAQRLKERSQKDKPVTTKQERKSPKRRNLHRSCVQTASFKTQERKAQTHRVKEESVHTEITKKVQVQLNRIEHTGGDAENRPGMKTNRESGPSLSVCSVRVLLDRIKHTGGDRAESRGAVEANTQSGPSLNVHSSGTADGRESQRLPILCPIVGENERRAAAFSGVDCGPTLPCPVSVTAVTWPSVKMSFSLSSSTPSMPATSPSLLSSTMVTTPKTPSLPPSQLSSVSAAVTSSQSSSSLSQPTTTATTTAVSSQPTTTTTTAVSSQPVTTTTTTTSVSSQPTITTTTTAVSSQPTTTTTTIAAAVSSKPKTTTTTAAAVSSQPTTAATTTACVSSITGGGKRKRCRDNSTVPLSVSDTKRELKKLKTDMTTGPLKQSLVSPYSTSSPARKVQASLQHWFIPTGKENANSSKLGTAGDSSAKAERQMLLQGGKFQVHSTTTHHHVTEKTALQSLQKARLGKEGGESLSERVMGGGKGSSSASEEAKSKNCSWMQVKKLSSSGSESDSLRGEISERTEKAPQTALGSALLGTDADIAVPSMLSSGHDIDSQAEAFVKTRTSDVEGGVELSDKVEGSCSGGVDSESANADNGSQHLDSSQNGSNKPFTTLLPCVTDSATSVNICSPGTSEQGPVFIPVVKKSLQNENTDCMTRTKARSVVRTSKKLSFVTRTRREKRPTTKMVNYVEKLRQKKKLKETAAVSSPEQLSPFGSPVTRRKNNVPAQRRKTVRGLCHVRSAGKPGIVLDRHDVRTLPAVNQESQSIESGSVVALNSSSSLKQITQAEEDKTDHEQQQTGAKLAAVVNSSAKHSDSVINLKIPSGKRALVHVSVSGLAEVKPSPSTTTSELSDWRCPRWRLSQASLPRQVDDVSQVSGSEGVPQSLALMIASCMDEGDFHNAVSLAQAAAGCRPSAPIFRAMVRVVKETGSHITVSQAHSLVMSWLHHFPPITKELRVFYEKALGLQDWETFRAILHDAVTEAETEPAREGNATEPRCGARMVLRIAIAALEKNFLHFAHNVSRKTRYNCMVVSCLWAPSYHVYHNSRLKDIITLLERALKSLNSPRACWQEMLLMVAMAGQCFVLAEGGWQWVVDGHVDQCSSALVHHIAQAIAEAGLQEVTEMQRVLSCLSPPWLLRQVVGCLMDDYDDYLVPGGFNPSPITLHTIVSKYFFLLPKLSPVDKSGSPCRKKLQKAPKEEEKPAAPLNPKLTAQKINKRNNKGETMLHRAAMSNNISLLKQMLTMPGVDVNSQDYAGWTALHEACNHGHVECVRALLKFVPSVTLDNFFTAGSSTKKMRKVDVMLANTDGITALHDAVNRNHISIVKLLLKYGGSALMDARTVDGHTAMDLAGTEEMRQVLASNSMDLSFSSQDSFSQELDPQERECVPSSFMYREVLDSSDHSTNISASLQEVRRFLALLILLLRSHLQVLQQQRQQLDKECSLQKQESLKTLQNGPSKDLQNGLSQSSVSSQKHNQESVQPQCEKLGEEEVKFYVQSFRRHIQKITSDEVFGSVRVQLLLLEALLTQCCGPTQERKS